MIAYLSPFEINRMHVFVDKTVLEDRFSRCNLSPVFRQIDPFLKSVSRVG